MPTQQDRGDAFEVFAEAYLATQKLVGAEEVWPADQVPIAVLQTCRLPIQDMGEWVREVERLEKKFSPCVRLGLLVGRGFVFSRIPARSAITPSAVSVSTRLRMRGNPSMHVAPSGCLPYIASDD